MAGFVHILPKFGLTTQHFLECVIPNLYDFSFFSEVNISVYFLLVQQKSMFWTPLTFTV